jgi:arylsulfatase A-like enzyme
MTGHLSALPSRASLAQRLETAGLPVDSDHVGMLQNDDLLGAILDKLDALGVADNTLVVYLSDHGVEPGKGTCYEQGVRIPMIMRLPQRIRAGSISAEPVQTIDLLPTFSELAGTLRPSPAAVDGVSLVPLFSGRTLDREALFFESGTFRGVLADGWKYIALRFKPGAIARMSDAGATVALDAHGRPRHLFSDLAVRYFPHYFDPDQLYDLSVDRWEQHSLAAEAGAADRLRRMRRLLEHHLASFEHPYPLNGQPFTETAAYRALADRRVDRASNKRWWHNDFHWPIQGGD